MGRRLKNFSYGAPGQIDDLARMPDFAHARAALAAHRPARGSTRSAAAWAARRRCCSSPGIPGLLAGAAALDSVTDLARRYDQMPQLPCAERCLERWGKPYGVVLQSTLAPRGRRRRRRRRRPRTPREAASARRASIACSRRAAPDLVEHRGPDRVGSGAPVAGALRRAAPARPRAHRSRAYVGSWAHSKEMRAGALLPIALSGFGLLPARREGAAERRSGTQPAAPCCERRGGHAVRAVARARSPARLAARSRAGSRRRLVPPRPSTPGSRAAHRAGAAREARPLGRGLARRAGRADVRGRAPLSAAAAATREAAKQTRLTASGVHYVAFSQPGRPAGRGLCRAARRRRQPDPLPARRTETR